MFIPIDWEEIVVWNLGVYLRFAVSFSSYSFPVLITAKIKEEIFCQKLH